MNILPLSLVAPDDANNEGALNYQMHQAALKVRICLLSKPVILLLLLALFAVQPTDPFSLLFHQMI